MAREATAVAASVLTHRKSDSIMLSDEQLLNRFLSGTDQKAEAAFADLIERYGPIVHRVCLDVLA